MSDQFDRVREWFRNTVGSPHGFQRQAWDCIRDGKQGLIHVPTGAGKTYAAYLPALLEAIDADSRGLRVLYLAPLRAMTRDICGALKQPVEDLNLDVSVETRTGDTKSSIRRKQRTSLPNVLLTTPESLSVLLTHSDAESKFNSLDTVIVDEWHELISSKRGTQTELGLARLRRWRSGLQVWGLSATLSNTDEAARSLVGPGRDYEIIRSELQRPIEVDSLVPDDPSTFPWRGNLGLEMAPRVLDVIRENDTSIVFTNTRSQAESWYRELLNLDDNLIGRIGLHHGSVDQEKREYVEDSLDNGDMTVVVSTSSLDLGVDFSPIEQIIQVGSVKGIARLIQRAGRSEHEPGSPCRVLCVPTNILQLFEFAAARRSIESRSLEARHTKDRPIDVLMQHFVTCAMGEGFDPLDLFDEIRDTESFRDLRAEDYHRALRMTEDGGELLNHYEFYNRLKRTMNNTVKTIDETTEKQHRVTIGTITSDPQVELRYTNNHRLGTVEEQFVSKLESGDCFIFAGKMLELVRMDGTRAYVRKSDRKTPDAVPRWLGGRLPISRSLSESLREIFADVRSREANIPEQTGLEPIIERQHEMSDFPVEGSLPVEILEGSDESHLFLYPVAGRLVQEGLATLLAHRLTNDREQTFSLSVNEFGLELASPSGFDFRSEWESSLISTEGLSEDIREAVNGSELTKRQFRRVARISGLIFEGYPGNRKSTKQLQESSSVLFKVLKKYDPKNPLFQQARNEALDRFFERERLRDALERLQEADLKFFELETPTPLGFSLMAERVSSEVSTESIADRIKRLRKKWTEV